MRKLFTKTPLGACERRRALIVTILLVTLSVPSALRAASADGIGAAGAEVRVVQAAGAVYMIQRPGGGGNVAAFVGAEGVLLVDSLFPPFAPSVVQAVGTISDKPIRYLINTHIHLDHIGGNVTMLEAGATILAHDNVRPRMQQRARWPRNSGSFGPTPPADALPFVTYSEAMTFHFEGEPIRVFLAPNAHTDGDSFVHFQRSNVLHLGDVFRTTSYPVVDVYNGGTVAGTLAALDQAIELADAETRVIPGHGLEVVGRDEMIEFRNMIALVRDRVRQLIDQGMDIDQVMAESATADLDAKWGRKKAGARSTSCRSSTTSSAVVRATAVGLDSTNHAFLAHPRVRGPRRYVLRGCRY